MAEESVDPSVPGDGAAPPDPQPTPTRPEGWSCSACGSTAVTAVPIVLADSTPVTFISCHRCEHRAWFSAAGELSREVVLGRAAKKSEPPVP